MLKRLLNTTSLKANIIANFGGNAWSALINLIFVPVYLKYIGAEGYGLIGIFASLQIVLSLLDSGLSTTLNKELARLNVLPAMEQKMRNLVKTLGSIYWIIALFAGLIAIFLSPLLAKFWVHPQHLSIQTITYSFILLSISIVFQFPIGFYTGGILGLQRQVMLNVLQVVFATLKSAGAVLILLFVSKSVLAFFSWTVAITVLQAFTYKYVLWFYLPPAHVKGIFDKHELKGISRFAAGITGISLTAILLTQIDKIILSKILSLDQFGYYTISCSLGMMIYQVISPLAQSYFPKFSGLASLNLKKELAHLYHQACQSISILVFPVTFTMIFFSRELIFIWTKSHITAENTWLITAIYAYGTGMNGLMAIPAILTLSYGWTKLGFYQNIAFLIILIPLTIFLALTYGAVGGALSWAIINTLYFFITPHFIHRRLLKGELAAWYWEDSLKPIFMCLIIIGAAKYFFGSTVYSNLKELFLIGGIAMTCVICVFLLTGDFNKNIMNIIKKTRS